MTALTPDVTPHRPAATTTVRVRGVVRRRAAMRAPVTDPTANTDPRIPYSPAFLSKTVRAMAALVSWKFSVRHATVPSTRKITVRSPREAT